MRESPYKSPEKGDTSACAPTLALLHVAELRRTRTQTWIIYSISRKPTLRIAKIEGIAFIYIRINFTIKYITICEEPSAHLCHHLVQDRQTNFGLSFFWEHLFLFNLQVKNCVRIMTRFFSLQSEFFLL